MRILTQRGGISIESPLTPVLEWAAQHLFCALLWDSLFFRHPVGEIGGRVLRPQRRPLLARKHPPGSLDRKK